MRAAPLALALALAVTPPGPPLARLAESLAEQIARVAKGRPVEIVTPEDRTGRGAAVALDFRDLLASRLEGRLALAQSGPRVRVEAVLTETARRIVASARVVEEPGGRLVDVLSASVENDATLLSLSTLPPPPSRAGLDVVSATRTPPLADPVLDVALFGDERLAVLAPDSVALYRWSGGELSLEARRALPGPFATVRSPGGMLAVSEGEDAFWALTSGSPRAVLYRRDGGRLLETSQAEALPWPGSPEGLRYVAGTNLIQATLAGIGTGPFLAVEADAAVSADGTLLLRDVEPGGSAVRVGPTLALLWPGGLAASSSSPPDTPDAILVLARDDGAVRVVDSLPVEGSVRVLASRAHGDTTRVVAGVVEADGGSRLLVLELRRREP